MFEIQKLHLKFVESHLKFEDIFNTKLLDFEIEISNFFQCVYENL